MPKLRCYPRWGDVVRLLRGRYPSVLAHTGSCATPVELSLPSAFSLVPRVLAGCTQSLLLTAASRRYSESLSLDAGSRSPAARRVLSPVSSTASSAFPERRSGRLPASLPRITTSRRPVFSRMQIFHYVPASKFAHPQVVSTAATTPQGSRVFTSGPIVLRYLRTHRIC